MKTTVIYHSADFDGIFCREIAYKFIPQAELIGWNFGDPVLPIPNTELYVMDLPLDAPFGFKYQKGDTNAPQHPHGLVWIDHHKTSIETHPTDIPGYRIDGVAACRLAWQWFTQNWGGELPNKECFINTQVNEPWAVRLAGEHDVWDHRDLNAEILQFGLRVEVPNWKRILNDDRAYVTELLHGGYRAKQYANSVDAEICNSRTWLMEWEGLKFLCVNHARFNSQLFAAKDIPETGHDALIGFCFNGKMWTVSLYHAAHRKELDLSEIAKKYGGGGHKGACGFTCKTLPFNL